MKRKNITLFIDTSREMAEVYLNRKSVFSGNFWDFYPTCHNSDLCQELSSKFGWVEGYESYVFALIDKLKNQGYYVDYKVKNTQYNDGKWDKS